MKGLDIAEAMLQQARDRLSTAERAISSGNYPYAVRSSQECVELSLKAALRAVGVEYPKKHDVSRVLLRVKDRFPAWFAVDEFVQTSRELLELREPAMYGDEVRMISPSALFRKEQADDVFQKARKSHEACQTLIRDFRNSATERVDP